MFACYKRDPSAARPRWGCLQRKSVMAGLGRALTFYSMGRHQPFKVRSSANTADAGLSFHFVD